MHSRDIFGIVVRTVGLLSLIYSFQFMFVWLAYSARFRSILEHGVREQALLFFVIGLVALRGAELIVRFAYPAGDATTAD